MDDIDLYNEIIWVMTHYGSDAGERAEPGSKLRAQAERIVAFVAQRELAYDLIQQHDLSLVKIISSRVTLS
jgi:hypothetical protein